METCNLKWYFLADGEFSISRKWGPVRPNVFSVGHPLDALPLVFDSGLPLI